MTRPQGSTAEAAFAAALAHLAARRPGPPDRPAFDHVVPGGAAPAGSPAVPRSAAGPPDGPLHAAAAALAAGEVSSRELVEDALACVAARSEALGALVDTCAERACAEAVAADATRRAGMPVGLLHGIPITVKDVIDVAGMPTRCGSEAYHALPEVDAVAVARARAAGAIVIGKAATHEFALGVTSPQSRNPHDPSRLPGGSSGGSAVAVATGMGLASIVTDTRASSRTPAALSGVVGFKPTYGAIPTAGVVSLSWTMDHVAPMARSVADAAALLEVLAGRPGWAAHAGDGVGGLRIGLAAAPFDGCEPAVAASVEVAVATLAADGARVSPSARPTAADLAEANAIGLIISRAEAAAFHRSLGLDRRRYWDEVREQVALGGEVDAIDYIDAQRHRWRLGNELFAAFSEVDVLAMPAAPVTAPLREDFAAHLMLLARNAIPWSLVGFPAVSVPCGAAGGLPVGVQLVAAPGREDHLVAAGCALERALR